jgi:hypothetical protein
MLPGQEGTITQVVVDARRASAGLLALALTLSVLIGLSLGVEAARKGRSAGAGKALCDGQPLGQKRGRPGSPWGGATLARAEMALDRLCRVLCVP